MDKPFFVKSIRFLLILFLAFTLYVLMKYLFFLLYPFLIAAILAYFMQAPVAWFEKHLKVSRTLATVSVASIAFIGMVFLFTFIITELIHGTAYLSERLPNYVQDLSDLLLAFFTNHILPIYEKLLSILQTLDNNNSLKTYEYITELHDHLALTGVHMLKNALLKIPYILSMLPYSFTVTIVIFIATFLIANDWNRLQDFLKKQIPDSIKKITIKVKNNLERSLFGYMKAQLILLLLTAIIIFIGLSILRIDHSFTITLFIAVIDLIPILGIGIVFIPWILYLFFTKSFTTTIGLCLLYMVTIVFRQMIEPKIVAESIGIHPLIALVILFVSVQVWGMGGILLAPVLFIICSALYQSEIIKILWAFINE